MIPTEVTDQSKVAFWISMLLCRSLQENIQIWNMTMLTPQKRESNITEILYMYSIYIYTYIVYMSTYIFIYIYAGSVFHLKSK